MSPLENLDKFSAVSKMVEAMEGHLHELKSSDRVIKIMGWIDAISKGDSLPFDTSSFKRGEVLAVFRSILKINVEACEENNDPGQAAFRNWLETASKSLWHILFDKKWDRAFYCSLKNALLNETSFLHSFPEYQVRLAIFSNAPRDGQNYLFSLTEDLYETLRKNTISHKKIDKYTFSEADFSSPEFKLNNTLLVAAKQVITFMISAANKREGKDLSAFQDKYIVKASDIIQIYLLQHDCSEKLAELQTSNRESQNAFLWELFDKLIQEIEKDCKMA